MSRVYTYLEMFSANDYGGRRARKKNNIVIKKSLSSGVQKFSSKKIRIN